ncbi:MAG: 50S ribosomal protein L25 [Bacteroidales bacterium]|nr:50S ribosomal protein L25 [Bacteroidales bacterium]
MKAIEFNAVIREKLGKKASKALRKKELIPCEVYGQGNNIHIAIEEKYLNKIVFTPYTHYAIINLNDKKIKAIVKEVQFNPVTDRISHIDFYEIVEDKPIEVKLPVKVVGLAKGVKDGGKLLQEMRYLKVKGLLKDMIEVIELNVESLGLGKSIHAGDVQLPNLKVVENPEKIVVTVKVTRGAVESSEGAEQSGTTTENK